MPSGRFAGSAAMMLCGLRVTIVETQGRGLRLRMRLMEGWRGRREFTSAGVEWIGWY
jgi:hypothetical protein